MNPMDRPRGGGERRGGWRHPLLLGVSPPKAKN